MQSGGPGLNLRAGGTAVVTGAASGIGLELARAFGLLGMVVVLADIEGPALDRAVVQLSAEGSDVHGVVTDVSSAASVAELAERVGNIGGPVDILCNNAGVGGSSPLDELNLDLWDWVLGVNLWGVIHGVRNFLPGMIERGRGHIVNTASVAGFLGFAGMAAYNVSKAGVISLSESLHHELVATGREGVRVSVLCPGFVDTAIVRSRRNQPDHIREAAPRPERERLRDEILRGYGAALDPSEVATRVLEGIRLGEFYIYTDDDFGAFIAQRNRAVEEGAVPPPLGHLFEHLLG